MMMIEARCVRRGLEDSRNPARRQTLRLSLALPTNSFDLVRAEKRTVEGYRSMSRLTKFKIERTSCRQKHVAPSDSPPVRPLACSLFCLTRSLPFRPSAAFRHPLKLDPEYPEKTWQLLENAIQEINADRSSGLSFEELHRNAYNMVVRRFPATLCLTVAP